MRNYLIEDFDEASLAKISAALKDKGYSGGLDDVFYIPLPLELLSEVQRAHVDECGPHICALELLPELGAVKLELLVRAQRKLRCECVVYATAGQRAWGMDFLDSLIRQLDISV